MNRILFIVTFSLALAGILVNLAHLMRYGYVASGFGLSCSLLALAIALLNLPGLRSIFVAVFREYRRTLAVGLRSMADFSSP